MKKIIITAAALYCTASCFAQTTGKQPESAGDIATPAIKIVKEPRFSVNIHSGYSVGLGSTFKFYPDDVSAITVTQNGNNPPSKTITYSNPTKGLGNGFKFGFGGSYIINDFINVGLDLDYFRSTIRKNRDSSIHRTAIPVNNSMEADEYYFSERNTISYEATLLSITPHITFKAISRPKWFLYNKIGGIITFRPNSLQDDVTDSYTKIGWQGFYQDSSTSTVKKYEWGIRNPAFGFMGAFGGQIKIGKNIRAFAELQFSHIVFVIRKRTLTDFIVDKQHIENSFPVSMREIEFVKSYSADVSNNDPNRPSQTIIQRIPISYVGMQAGITFQVK